MSIQPQKDANESGATKFLSNAVKTASKVKPKADPNAFSHAPTVLNNQKLEERKNTILDVYENYEGDSLEELKQLLVKNKIHVHNATDVRDGSLPVARAFYHEPVIATVGEEKFVLDEFFMDLRIPKDEPKEEEEKEEEAEGKKKKNKKSLFRKRSKKGKD